MIGMIAAPAMLPWSSGPAASGGGRGRCPPESQPESHGGTVRWWVGLGGGSSDSCWAIRETRSRQAYSLEMVGREAGHPNTSEFRDRPQRRNLARKNELQAEPFF